MKIAFIIDTISKVGGIEKATIELANQLIKINEYEVNLIAIYKSYVNPIEYEIDKRINIIYVSNKTYMKYNVFFYRVYFYVIKPKLNHIINKNKFDVVLYTNIKFSDYKKKKYKKILVLHSKLEYFLKGTLTRLFLKKYHNSFDKVVFLTEADMIEYNQYYGANNSEFIYNISSVRVLEDITKLKNKNICYVGRLDIYEKQVDKLLRIFKQANTKNDWNLLLYGEGSDREKLELLCEQDDIKNVFFMGSVTNVENVFSCCQINVLCSKIEGLPMSLIEASFSGVPSISYNVSSGIYQIIIDNESGFVIEFENEDDYIQKLMILMDDHDLRYSMGKMAMDNAKKNFSTNEIIAKWMSIF